MAWTEKQRLHFAELNRIFTRDQCGTVDGVEFDVRHELLDPAEWQAAVVGMSRGYRSEDSDGPFIWFPWFGEFDKEKVRQGGLAWVAKTVEMSDSSDTLLTLPERSRLLAQYITAHTPDCIIHAGDKIVIRKVNSKKNTEEFDHPHDSEIRLVYLRVIRADGRLESIRHPIKFSGTRSIFAKEGNIDYHDVILKRICEYFNLKDIEAFFQINVDTDASRAATIASFLHDDLDSFRTCLEETDVKSAQYIEARKQMQLANDSVLLGYCWARAELELKMKPLALSALRMKASSALGGSKGAETRRKKAEEGWIAIAKKMAIKIRAEKPHLSQDKVAEEISFTWKDEIQQRGHARLKQLVGDMEKSGELPKRQHT